jgi:subtilase family serine protease
MTKTTTFHTRGTGKGTSSLRRVRRFVLSVLVAAASLAAATAADAAQTFVAGRTYFAIGVPVCTAPKQVKAARCFAVRRVLVDEKTSGALPFKPGAGALGNDTIGPAGGLTPSDLTTAYALPTADGAGQTVAVVDAYNDPNIAADLKTFDTNYGLKACTKANGCLKVVGQTGTTTSLPANDTTGWSVEESLDVETVHSVCPKCKIVLVEANSPSDSDLGTAENTAVALGATVVSNSFGGEESGATTQYLSAFNHPGVVIVASTGDDGYYDFDYLDSDSQPNFPASSPNVVAVGGTSLYLGETAARQSETVWNDNGVKDYWEHSLGRRLGATGGGCSTRFTAKTWQTHVAGWKNTACVTKRLAADVAAVADYLTGLDVYDSYGCAECSPAPGWFTVGGTSLAAPLIAGTFALAGGANGVDYPAQTLYQNIGMGYDVTVGGNGWCDGAGAAECGDPNLSGFGIVDCDYSAAGDAQADGACDALTGFDGPTGVGTPKGLALFKPAASAPK